MIITWKLENITWETFSCCRNFFHGDRILTSSVKKQGKRRGKPRAKQKTRTGWKFSLIHVQAPDGRAPLGAPALTAFSFFTLFGFFHLFRRLSLSPQGSSVVSLHVTRIFRIFGFARQKKLLCCCRYGGGKVCDWIASISTSFIG